MKFNDMMGTQGTHHVIANQGISGQELPRCEKASCKIALFPKPGIEATCNDETLHIHSDSFYLQNQNHDMGNLDS